MKLPTRFQLIGQVGLQEYEKWVTWFQEKQAQNSKEAEPITFRSYARYAREGKRGEGRGKGEGERDTYVRLVRKRARS